MDVSIVILNYNAGYFLDLCLSSVERAIKKVDGEVIIVDNCSTDHSFLRNSKNYSQFTFINNETNLGFAKGNNVAIPKCKGDYVLFLNPDTLISEDCLINTLTYSKKNPEIGLIGVRMIDGAGNFLPESKRSIPTPGVSLRKMIGTHKIFPKSKYWSSYYSAHINEHSVAETEVLSGAFFWVKKEAGDKVGWWDDRYFMYAEDIDFSWSVAKAGFKTVYKGDETIVHFKGESTSPENTKAHDSFYYSMKQFYNKNFNDFASRLIKPLIFTGVNFGKKLSKRYTPKTELSIDALRNYVLVGSNPKTPGIVKEILEAKPMEIINNSMHISTAHKNNYIIFDDSISTKEVVQFMSLLSPKQEEHHIAFALNAQKAIVGSGTKHKSGFQFISGK